MSNCVDIQLDVLASSPDQINDIELSLQQPCDELLKWVATKWDQTPEQVAGDLKRLITFQCTRNLGAADPTRNKARRFRNSFRVRRWGLVLSHLYFVSREFPNAVFLMEYWDTCMSYAGKSVIKEGREIRQIHDGNQQAQGSEWVLPNIFAPYESEYQTGQEFGLFWDSWVLGMEDALSVLKSRYGTPKVGSNCESALREWEGKFEQAAEAAESGFGRG